MLVVVVTVIAAVGIIVAVAYAFQGRGGELSVERSDYVPLDLGPVSATDVALLRPPTAMWGYSVEATDEAMAQIAESIRERDVRIVALEQLVTDLGRDHAPMTPLGSPYAGARHRRAPGDGAADTETLRWADREPAWQPPEQSWEAQEPSWQGQEPSWQEQDQAHEPEQAQPWQDHEAAWQQDQDDEGQDDQGQDEQGLHEQGLHEQGQDQSWQEQAQPWQSPEAPWQSPEQHPTGDSSQQPPPERSHD